MNEAERKILDLLEKFHSNTATAEELSELERWYASFENDPKWTTGLSKEKFAATGGEMLDHIRKEVKEQAPSPARKPAGRKGVIVAAAVIAIVSVFFISRLVGPKSEDPGQPDILPGKNAAVLTLSNGRHIDLSLAKNGMIYSGWGLEITKASNGVIVYHAITNQLHNGSELNTLTTPSGGQFEVMLADGTKVWLNAMSTLTYPARFDGNKRPVALTGEAYFEVAKNKEKPFDVNTAKERVEVLGTHFNINAYADEDLQRTTLLEGSVRVTAKQKNMQAIIKPGQQVTGSGDQLVVTVVDADDAAGWKDGLFIFNHTELHSLMRQVSRWYNIDIVYQGKFEQRSFSGSIDRSYTLVQLLDVLKVSKVNFKIEKTGGMKARNRLILIP